MQALTLGLTGEAGDEDMYVFGELPPRQAEAEVRS